MHDQTITSYRAVLSGAYTDRDEAFLFGTRAHVGLKGDRMEVPQVIPLNEKLMFTDTQESQDPVDTRAEQDNRATKGVENVEGIRIKPEPKAADIKEEKNGFHKIPVVARSVIGVKRKREIEPEVRAGKAPDIETTTISLTSAAPAADDPSVITLTPRDPSISEILRECAAMAIAKLSLGSGKGFIASSVQRPPGSRNRIVEMPTCETTSPANPVKIATIVREGQYTASNKRIFNPVALMQKKVLVRGTVAKGSERRRINR